MSAPPHPYGETPVDSSLVESNALESTAHEERAVPRRRFDRVIVWAVTSILISSYLAIGSISTKFWQLDAFQQAWVQRQASRRVLHVWTYQFNHLPKSTSETLLKIGFAGALLVVVVGVIAGIWLILDQADTTAASPHAEAVDRSVRHS